MISAPLRCRRARSCEFQVRVPPAKLISPIRLEYVQKRLKSGCDLCIPLKLTLVMRMVIPSDGVASYGASAETVRPPSHMKALVSQFSFGAVLISGRCLG